MKQSDKNVWIWDEIKVYGNCSTIMHFRTVYSSTVVYQFPYWPEVRFFLFPKLRSTLKYFHLAGRDEINNATTTTRYAEDRIHRFFGDSKKRKHYCVISIVEYFEGYNIILNRWIIFFWEKREFPLLFEQPRNCF